MIKRIPCLILALLTVLSLASPALGDEAPEESEPAQAPASTETPQPTEAPASTETPQPTEAPAPAETPQPTEAPAPAAAPEPAPVKEAAKLPAPAIGKPSCTAEGARLSWSPVPGAAQYRVYYKTAAGNWKKIAVTTATILTWVGAKSGTKYTFTVRAFDSAGKGGYYDTAGKTLAYVAAPRITKTSFTAGGVKLQWNGVSGAAGGYRVFYKTPGGWKKAGDASGTSFTWKKVQSGESYTFTVRCLASNKKSYVSSYDPVGRTVTYLAPPVLRKASCADGGVQVQWDPVPGAAQYRVFYKTTGGWKKAGVTAGTSFLWPGARSGTKYAFTVRCLSADGTAYTSSYDDAGKSVAYVAAPRITNAESTVRGMELTWDPVPGAARYRVFLKTPNSWKKLGDAAGTGFTWADAQYGIGYVFTVRCLSADGKKYISSYDDAGYAAIYSFLAARPLDNLGRVSGLCQGNRGCCMATSFSMAANLILGRDEYGPYDWTAGPTSDALNISGGTSFEGSDGRIYRPYVSSADSAEGLRDAIDQALASGCPIISSVQNRSTANTHYAVLVGWTDEEHSDYLVADPSVASGPMTTCAVPMRGNRNLSLGNKNGTFVYIAFSRS